MSTALESSLDKLVEFLPNAVEEDADKAKDILSIIKDIFDYSNVVSKRKFGPFDELQIEGFDEDEETIWEELQTRNRPLTRYLKSSIARINRFLQLQV